MTEKKKISLNFGRIDKAQVGAMAADTLGDAAVGTQPETEKSAPDAGSPRRGPIAFVMLDDQTLEVKETGLTSTFNFETQQVSYTSTDPKVNGTTVPFDKVSSRTVISQAYINLCRLGGFPRPYP